MLADSTSCLAHDLVCVSYRSGCRRSSRPAGCVAAPPFRLLPSPYLHYRQSYAVRVMALLSSLRARPSACPRPRPIITRAATYQVRIWAVKYELGTLLLPIVHSIAGPRSALQFRSPVTRGGKSVWWAICPVPHRGGCHPAQDTMRGSMVCVHLQIRCTVANFAAKMQFVH